MHNKNRIFVLISIIVIFLVVGLYLSHKNKKDTYIDVQKARINLYFKVLISSSDNHQFTGDINYDPKTLGTLFKQEDPADELTPNDIIKKKT